MEHLNKRYCIAMLSVLLSMVVNTGHTQCGPATPTFVVNLTGNPAGTWTSPLVSRNDNCCGTTAPDKCVKFVITLDPAAQGIAFSITSGAIPGGALFYQINCGPPTAVGSPICLSGPGPHILTFCKPGNNANTYAITSIPGPTAGNDIVVNDGCIGNITATGFDPATITWNSIAPGAPGTYNNYLSCTSGCSTVQVASQPGFPSFVDYVVCGIPAAQCNLATTCDTVRVTFNPTLGVNITPLNPTVCFGQSNITLTANGSGGTPPYTYLWNTGATTASIPVGAGTYNVIMGDASGCPPVSASVTVTAFANPITANAGNDIYMCPSATQVTLNGSVTGTTTGIWSGGNGSFVPNNTALNATYTPTAGEIANGFLDLILSTTNNGTCPGDADTVRVFFVSATLTMSNTPVSCFGVSNGTATVNVSGSYPAISYSWNSSPVQTTPTATGLPAGTYIVTVTLAGGCTITGTTTVTQPAQITGSLAVTSLLCSGQCNGSVNVTASGGTGTLQYSLNGGPLQTSPAFTGLCSGPVTVSVQDANGCTLLLNGMMTQPPALTVSVTSTTGSTCGSANGSITVAGNGGTPVLQYSNGGPFQPGTTFNGLTAGSYTITVQDANGCTATVSAVVPGAGSPVLSIQNQNNLSCFGGSNGSVLLNTSGGTSPLSYMLSGAMNVGPQASNLFTNLVGGSYTATVTDANGCTSVVNFTLTSPPQLTYTTSLSGVSCNGTCDGQINFSPAGGTPGYQFSVNNGLTFQSTNPVTGLCAGNIFAVVQDANGCLVNSTVVINSPTVLSATFANVSPVCHNACDGQITINASGGATPYQYSVDGGALQVGNIFAGLCAGNHTMLVEDANGCQFTSVQTLTNPPGYNVNIVSVTSSNCGFNDGAFEVAASGGNPPYLYSANGSPNQASGVFANIVGGAYTVIVTDALGCQEQIFVGVNDVQMSATLNSTTDATCFGSCDGAVDVINTGGAAPITYDLDNSGLTQPLGVFTGLCAGSHLVAVYDAGFCVATVPFVINEPAQISFSTNLTNISCNGGANGQIAFTSVAGGTGAYQYSINGAGGPYQPGTGFTGLSAGTYNLAVQDANGCIVTSTVTLSQPAPITFVVNANDLTCFNNNSGFLQVVASGGVPSYQVGVTGPQNFPLSPAFTFPNVPAGTYNFTVQDANGCQVTGSATLNQPTAVTATYTTTATSCSNTCDGSVQVNAAGGTPPFLYSPDNGVTFFTSSLLSGLCAGAYPVMVTDNNNCPLVATQNITSPPAVTLSATSTPSTCGNTNGSITLTAGGGTPGYTYSNNNGITYVASATFAGLAAGTYNIATQDNNGCTATGSVTIANQPSPLITSVTVAPPSCFGSCNASATINVTGGTGLLQYNIGGPNQASAIFNGQCAGNYTATVTDANGCQDVHSFAIVNPPPVTVSATSVNLTCFQNASGSITLTAGGGTGGGYQYSINGGTTFQSGATFNSLAAGTYIIVVKDANGCTATTNVTLSQPNALTVVINNSSSPTCSGSSNGFITATPGGGTPGYTYAWNTSPVQTGATATGLGAGTFSVVVTDANGCTANTSSTLIMPSPVQTYISPPDTICLGQSTVMIATATGGSGSYVYAWAPSLGTSGTQTVSPATTTTYMVTAFDGQGCSGNPVSVQIVVYNLTPANLTVNAYTPICPGTSTTIYAAVSGSQGPLNYTWTNGLGPGPGAFVVTPSVPTTYAVTVSNACGAIVNGSVTVTFNPPPTINFVSDTVSGCPPLTVNFTDLSSTVPNDSILTWQWDFGDGGSSNLENPSHVYPNTGTYNVTLSVITYGGCTNNSSSNPYLITVYPKPNAAFTASPTTLNLPYDNLSCTNQSTGAISYAWNFGDGSTSTTVNPIHVFQNIGNYTVSLIATNQFGCTDTAYQPVIATSDIVFPNAFTPNSSGSNGGTYTIQDLTNDVFFPFTSGVDQYRLMIFNRWGELIFESTELRIGWDGYYRGVICPQDVYVWKAEVTFTDGREFKKTGDVTLLR